MAWLVLAAILAMWPHEPETRCAESEHHLARQRLTGAAGVATVDVSTDGRVVAFVSLARLTAADDNTAEDIYVLDRATGAISAGERHRHRPGVRRIEPASAIERRWPLPRLLDRRDEPDRFDVARLPTRRCCGAIAPPASRRSCHARRPALRATGGAASRTSATTGASWSSSPTPPTSSPASTATAAAATSTCSTPPTAGSGASASPPPASSSRTARAATPAISGTGRVVAFSSTAPLDAPPGQPRPPDVPPRRLRARPRGRRDATHQRQPRSRRPERRQLLPRDQRRRAPRRVRVHRDQPRRRRSRQKAAGERLPLRRGHAPTEAAQPEHVGRRRRRRQPASRGERRRPLRALQLGRVEPPLHRPAAAPRPTSTW